jgi:DNA-binding NarL/FixJ family response regulator
MLTPREVEVLRLIAADRRNAEIAGALCVCVKTVESHVSSALEKLGVRSRPAAVLKARDLGLL